MYNSIRFALMICFCMCCSSLWGAAAPGSPDHVRELIAQLDHDDFDKREDAMEKLVNIGEKTMPFLRKALEDKNTSPEAVHRVRYLLGSLSGPEHGVVWRTLISPGMYHREKPQVPKGIQAGDVIVEIAGEPIDSDEAVSCFRGRSFTNAQAKIWRKGKIVPLNLSVNSETTLCFHLWPDPTRRYELYGHHGDWDKTVHQALAVGTLYSNSRCEPLFQKAFDAGCRDAMVIHYWAAHLVKLGKLEEAEKIVLAARKEELHGHPGGRFLYCELPILHARIFRHQSKFDEAGKTIATAVADADKNGAFEAIKSLKYQLLRNVRYDENPDPLAHLKNAANFPYDVLATKDIAFWCQFVSRKGDPSRALVLLAYLKPKVKNRDRKIDHLKELVKYYETQETLAKAYKASPAAKRKNVAVMCDFGFWTCNVPAGRYMPLRSMPEFKTPGAISVRMRYWEFPENYGAWAPVYRFGCEHKSETDPMSFCLSFTHHGAYDFNHCIKHQRPYPDRLCSAMEWGDTFGDKWVKFSMQNGKTQMSVNGQVFRTWYVEEKLPEKMRAFIFLSSARAWFYNFIHYAYTDADVDPSAVENAWHAWHGATKEGDGKKMEETAGKLLTLLKPIPEAKAGIAFVNAVQNNYKAIHTDDGWSLDPKTLLNDPLANANGLWEPSGDWLVGLSRPDWRGEKLYCQVPMVLPESFEITGQVAAEGRMCPHLMFTILWNNNLKYLAPATALTKPDFSVSWTQVPKSVEAPAGTQAVQAFINRMKKQKTFSFCLRKVGPKAAVYVNGLKKPLLIRAYRKRHATGQFLCFNQNCPHGAFMLRDIKVRAIDAKTDLNAPVKLPQLKPVPTRGALKKLYARQRKIKAEMQKK